MTTSLNSSSATQSAGDSICANVGDDTLAFLDGDITIDCRDGKVIGSTFSSDVKASLSYGLKAHGVPADAADWFVDDLLAGC